MARAPMSDYGKPSAENSEGEVRHAERNKPMGPKLKIAIAAFLGMLLLAMLSVFVIGSPTTDPATIEASDEATTPAPPAN